MRPRTRSSVRILAAACLLSIAGGAHRIRSAEPAAHKPEAGKLSHAKRLTGSYANPVAQPVLPALRKADVYVAPELTDKIDPAALAAIAHGYGTTKVKIGVIPDFPVTPMDQASRFLHAMLALNQGILILAESRGGATGHPAVAVYAPQVDAPALKRIGDDATAQMTRSYTDAIRSAADQTAAAVSGHGPGRTLPWIPIVAALVVIGFAAAFMRPKRR